MQTPWSGQLTATMGWACSGHRGWLAVFASSTTAESQANCEFQTSNNIIPKLTARKIHQFAQKKSKVPHPCCTPKLERHHTISNSYMVVIFICHMCQDTPRCSQVAKWPHALLAKWLGMQPPCMGTMGRHQLKQQQVPHPHWGEWQHWVVLQVPQLAQGLVQQEPSGPSARSSDPSAGATKGPQYHNIMWVLFTTFKGPSDKKTTLDICFNKPGLDKDNFHLML